MKKHPLILLPLIILAGGTPGCRTASSPPRAPFTPAETQPGDVKFDLIGPNDAFIIVPVQINGRGPYSFILDTGATMTCVDKAVAEQLDLPSGSGSSGIISGVRGPSKVTLTKIESFKLGSAEATGLPACAIDLQHIQKMGVKTEGIVGLNYLKRYRVILNFDRETLRLEDPSSPEGSMNQKEQGNG